MLAFPTFAEFPRRRFANGQFRIPAMAFPPLKRLAFATHAAVSRFAFMFRVPVLGGRAFPMEHSIKRKKKCDPRLRGGFVFLSLFNPWAFGAGWAVLIDRSVGRLIDLFAHSRARPFMGGLMHSPPNAGTPALTIQG